MNSDGLPPLLMTSEPGSFARSTITERKPQIIARVIEDNDYPSEITAALEAFRQEIALHPIQPLTGPASDTAFWNKELAAHRGRTWLELPWYLAEAAFYRRLLEAVRYFAPGPWQGHDPFAAQKRKQDRAAVDWLSKSWRFLADLEPEAAFTTLLHSSLWGNRADLSNFTVREQASGGLDVRQEQHNLLIDHTDRVLDLVSAGLDRVDFVSDNASRELLFDLALADFLLDQRWVRKIVLHLKDCPFFVSDAMPDDVHALLYLLRKEALGQQIEQHLASGRLLLRDHPFWTSSLMFRKLPPPLCNELAQSDLVILKGDVNYRRLLDDRHWPHTAQIEEIGAYFPAPFLVLRTLKGEIMVGLEQGQAEKLSTQDPDWLINGKRGIVQLVTKPKVT
jgi:hypothetical protein